MDCKETQETLRQWLETAGFGWESRGANGDIEEALAHIRECRGKECSSAREALESLWRTAVGFGKGIEPAFEY